MTASIPSARPFAILVTIGIALATMAHSQAQLIVQGPASCLPQHVAVTLPADQRLETDVDWQLVDTENPSVRLPVQLTSRDTVTSHDTGGEPSNESQRLMLVTVPATASRDTLHKYRLEKSSNADSQKEVFRFVEQGETSLQLVEQDQPVLTYNFEVVTDQSVPEDDSRRSRACYIHPVWGLGGEILTDDFPRDHFHHHGVFWAWPYVKVGEATYDLWMYSDIQQRFVRWLNRETGRVAACIGVENGWFVGDRKVVTERVWISAYRAGQNARAIDLSITLTATEQPVTIQGRELKSYGGLTFRYDVTPRTDATVRIPGRTLDEDLLNTPLPWADLTSRFPNSDQRSGASVFIHPTHPDYPPSWLTRRYGALCVGWPGIKPHTLQPGEPVTLKYRLWIHRTEETADTIGQVYASYRQSQSDGWLVAEMTGR